MKAEHYRDEQLTAYLLGSLPPGEVEHFDELSITDDEFALRLQVLENDLVDAYVRGELTPLTLERFESYYLASPLRREKVDFARRFTSAGESRARPAPPRTPRISLRLLAIGRGWHSVYPVAVCLLAVVGIWLAAQTARLRHERDLLREQHRNAELRARQLEQAQSAGRQTATQPLTILAFNLLPQTRGATELPLIALPPGVDSVNAQARLESSEYKEYDAGLFTLPRRERVWTATGLPLASGGELRFVQARIPASLLKTGTYLLQISARPGVGKQDIAGSYAFRIVRQ